MEQLDTSVRAEQTRTFALGRSLVHAGRMYMQNIKPRAEQQQRRMRSNNAQWPGGPWKGGQPMTRPWMVAVPGTQVEASGGLTRAEGTP